MSAASDQLSSDEHARILRDKILPASDLESLQSHVRPTAIILAGQPGAGKGGLSEVAKGELFHDAAVIDPDALRRFHPDVVEFRRQNPVIWSGRTHIDASAWADEILDVASAARKNLILDKTLGNGERAVELIRGLQQKGYSVEVRVVAAHKLESELGVDGRFTQNVDRLGHGRHVPESAREEIYNNIPRSLRTVQEATDVPIIIYSREGQRLFDSQTDNRPAGTALEEERSKRLRDPAVTQYLRASWGKQVEWHEGLPVRAHAIPGMDPDTHARMLQEQASQGLVDGARLQAHVGATVDEVFRPGAAPALVIREPRAPNVLRTGVGVGATVVGLAASAYDAHETGERVGALLQQQNLPAAQSELTHFAARGIGGWAGGTLAAGIVGTSGAGPVALVAADAYLFSKAFEKAATLRDSHAIYQQKDKAGTEWEYNGYSWVREVALDRTQDGIDNPIKQDVSANYEKARELNALASARAVELELGRVPAPQDPFNIPARADDQYGLDNPNWRRDAQSEQWVRQVKTGVTGVNDRGTYAQQIASPERAEALDREAMARVEGNIANGKEAVAAAYLEGHAALRSGDFVEIPPAVEYARAKADSVFASDGHLYRLNEDGQWMHGGSAAQGNLALELNLTRQIRQPSLEQFNARLAETSARPAPSNAEVDRSELLHRYQNYNVRVPEEWVPAIELATQRTREANGLTGRTLQELQRDGNSPYSAESAVAHYQAGPDGVAHRVAMTSAEDIRQAHRDLQERQEKPTLQDTPELRIDALSADERDAYQQALREANRQGASTDEAAQLAALAAMRADGRDVAEARVPELLENEPSTNNEPPPSQPAPHLAAAAIAASVGRTAVEEQSTAQREPQTAQGAEQGAREHIEEQRAQEGFARTAEEEKARREASVAEPQAHTAPTSPDIASTPVQPVSEAEPVARPPVEVPDLAATVAASEAKVEHPVTTEAVPETAILMDASQPEVAVQAEASERPSMEDAASTQHPLRDEVSLDEPVTEAPPREVVEQVVVAEQPDAIPLKEPANDVIANQAVPEQQPEPEPEPAMERVAQPADEQEPWTPLNPEHPDHALYQQIREGVAKLDEAHGRSYDQTSERLTGSLMVLAKSNGLDSVDHVVLSQPTESQPGGQNVFVVQGELDNPGHHRAGMPTAQAVKTPFEESLEQFDVAAFEQEQRAAQLATQQQEEDQRVQQEMQVAAASMGY